MGKHSKNQPTLLDNLLAKNKNSDPNAALLKLRQAQRFVLDRDASHLVGSLVRGAASLMMREHEFARPPYDPTWIEIDYPAYMHGLGHEPNPNDKTVDLRVGYFYGAGNLLFVTETAEHPPSVMPYWFKLHSPQLEELELAQMLKITRLQLRQIILGNDGIPDDWWNSADATAFFRSHPLMISPTVVKELKMNTHHIVNMLLGGAGSLKQGIALLLLLGRPGQATVHLSEQPHRQGIIRGSTRTLLSHHKVTIHLSVPEAVRKVVDTLHSTGIHHRRHSVRGHWAQTRRNVNGCTHSWEPETVDKYHCLDCKAKRWWRVKHNRGDIALGMVTKEYEVTE